MEICNREGDHNKESEQSRVPVVKWWCMPEAVLGLGLAML